MCVVVEAEDYEKIKQLSETLGFNKSQIVRLAIRLMFKLGIYRSLKILEDHE